jgi:hypothetical protein
VHQIFQTDAKIYRLTPRDDGHYGFKIARRGSRESYRLCVACCSPFALLACVGAVSHSLVNPVYACSGATDAAFRRSSAKNLPGISRTADAKLAEFV